MACNFVMCTLVVLCASVSAGSIITEKTLPNSFGVVQSSVIIQDYLFLASLTNDSFWITKLNPESLTIEKNATIVAKDIGLEAKIMRFEESLLLVTTEQNDQNWLYRLYIIDPGSLSILRQTKIYSNFPAKGYLQHFVVIDNELIFVDIPHYSLVNRNPVMMKVRCVLSWRRDCIGDSMATTLPWNLQYNLVIKYIDDCILLETVVLRCQCGCEVGFVYASIGISRFSFVHSVIWKDAIFFASHDDECYSLALHKLDVRSWTWQRLVSWTGSYCGTAWSLWNDHLLVTLPAFYIDDENGAEPAPPSVVFRLSIGTPSSPSVVLAALSPETVELQWKLPSDSGAAAVVNFTIYRNEVYIATVDQFQWIDSGLAANFTYFYCVKAVNLYGEGRCSVQSVSTPPGIPLQPQLSLSSVEYNVAKLNWTLCDVFGVSSSYIVERRVWHTDSDWIVLDYTSALGYNDTSVVERHLYEYQVTAQNRFTRGLPSDSIVVQVPPSTSNEQRVASVSTGAIIAGGAVLILLVTVGIAGFLIIKEYTRTQIFYKLKSNSTLPVLEQLTLLKKPRRGSGSQGTVFEASLDDRRIAAKRFDIRKRADFMAEIQVANLALHEPSIVTYYGLYIERNALYLCMELLESLSKALLLGMTQSDLILISKQLSAAMVVLHSSLIVHGDLALRNVLIRRENDTITAKICDFGHCKKVEHKTSWTQLRKGELVPNTAAIETIKERKIGLASDSWSFAVMLWEILSLGQQPYAHCLDATERLHFIEKEHGKLDQPDNCPSSMYALMERSWHFNPMHRPLMEEYKEALTREYTKCSSPQFDARAKATEVVRTQTISGSHIEMKENPTHRDYM